MNRKTGPRDPRESSSWRFRGTCVPTICPPTLTTPSPVRSLTQYWPWAKKIWACASWIPGNGRTSSHFVPVPIVTGSSLNERSVGTIWMIMEVFVFPTGGAGGGAARSSRGATGAGGGVSTRGGSVRGTSGVRAGGRTGVGGGGGEGAATATGASFTSVRKLTLGPPSAKARTSPLFRNVSVIRLPLTKVPLVLLSTRRNWFPSRTISACVRERTVTSAGNRTWHDGWRPTRIDPSANSWIRPFNGPERWMRCTTMSGGRFI